MDDRTPKPPMSTPPDAMDEHCRAVIDAILADTATSPEAESAPAPQPLAPTRDSRICDSDAFATRVEQALHRADRSERLLSLVLIHVDIQPFNPSKEDASFGHEGVEDRVLNRIASCLRRSDSILNCGAGLFAIVLEELHEPGAVHFAVQKIHDALSLPFTWKELHFHTLADIGVSLYPSDGHQMQPLWHAAQTSLGDARKQGPGATQFANPGLQWQNHENQKLGGALHEAFRNQQFRMFYLPHIDMRSGRATRVEALLRWQHPERGLLPPERFLTALEESGLILAMGSWILETACEQALKLKRSGHIGVPVVVNVAERQLLDPEFTGQVERSLVQTGCPPELLQLEWTEEMLSRHFLTGATTLKELRAVGVGVRLDHFSGHSPVLTDLLRLPLAGIQLDRPIVRQLTQDRTFQAVTSGLLALSGSLGIPVSACGVTDEEQLEFLRERGCSEAQGYLYTPPLSSRDLDFWLPN